MREFFKKIIGAIAVVAILTGATYSGVEVAKFTSRATTDSVVQVLVYDKNGKEAGHGSGTYLGNGVYLTAAHVADQKGENTYVIKHQGGTEVKVLDVRADAKRDVALLFAGADVNIIPQVDLFCDYRGVGDDIYAKGYPMSLGLVETEGKIVSKASQWGPWANVYRVDVALGPGMSGGPVFDSYGYQIGINIGVALMPIGFAASSFGVNLIVPTTEVCDYIGELNYSGTGFKR
jgi:serine protease Do